MKKNIEVVPYNPNWPHFFEEESQRIKQALGDNCLEIHHIGSTSIPGLAARSDIDILCIVNDLSTSLGSLGASRINFIFKGESNIPLRYFFPKTLIMLK